MDRCRPLLFLQDPQGPRSCAGASSVWGGHRALQRMHSRLLMVWGLGAILAGGASILLSPSGADGKLEAMARRSALAGGSRASLSVVQLSDDVPGHCSNPRLSPSGTSVAFERRDDERRGRQVRLVSISPGSSEGRVVEQPVLLGSGSSSSLLAAFNAQTLPVLRDFVWTPPGPLQRAHPYVVAGAERDDAAGIFLSGIGRLTADRAVEGHPAFSKEGAVLVFVSSRSGEGDLYSIGLTEPGRPIKRLTMTELEAELYPVWHPQSDTLFFVRHGSSGDQVVQLEGVRRGPLREVVLTRGVATRTAPSVSPNGEWLAWYGTERQPDQLDLMVLSLKNPAGSGPRCLLTNGISGERHGPAWLPDSSGLVAVQSNAQALDPLVVVSLRDGAVSRLSTGTVHNREPEVGEQRGRPYLVFTAQGRSLAASERSWQRVYGGVLE